MGKLTDIPLTRLSEIIASIYNSLHIAYFVLHTFRESFKINTYLEFLL